MAAASPQTPTSPAGTQTTTSTPERPTWLPESYWKDGKIDDAFGEHYAQQAAAIAAEQVKALSKPQTPDAYKIELPADFKPPEGVEFKFNADDPLLSQARTIAHELGIPQEGFSKLLSLYAGSQVATEGQVKAARDAEVAKLGAAGPARIDALSTFWKATLGADDGARLMSRLFTADDVKMAEKLVAKLSGSTSFKASAGREAPQAQGKVSPDQWSKMTAAERWSYAKSHDQSQFASNNGRAA